MEATAIKVGQEVTVIDYKYRNETFVIESIEDISEKYPNIARTLIQFKKDPIHYTLRRVVTGRKKAYSIPAYRFSNTGRFMATFH
jgi:hypothetical protein